MKQAIGSHSCLIRPWVDTNEQNPISSRAKFALWLELTFYCALYLANAVPPVTTVNPEHQVVEEGVRAVIECNVTGLPLPNVQWRDRDNRLITGSREGMFITNF